MPKQLKIYPEKCIGCKSCELVCSFINDGEFNLNKARITTINFIEGKYSLPYNFVSTCKQCADAPCLHSCPVEAIYRMNDEKKAIVIDVDKCIGCGLCVKACPFGAMLFNEEKKAFKCELCGERDPACATVCPTEAITFTEHDPFFAKAEALQIEGFAVLSQRNRDNVKSGKRKK
jgi:Fe-S-cluster-containing hydrogenase component 2